VLSDLERLKVASAIAIKYGLTLYGTPYLGSDGTKLWDDRVDGSYGLNIVGVGRDVEGAIDQRRSTSANERGFLTLHTGIAASWNDASPALPDQNFLLIGDDGGQRRWRDREQGQPQYLDRSWLLRRTGTTAFTSKLHLSRRAIENSPEQEETVWLVIDHSGNGEFSHGEVEYLGGTTANSDGMYTFDVMEWDADGSGKDVFRLAAGGSFIPKFWVDSADCSTSSEATVHVGVAGGQPDVRISLRQMNGSFERTLVLHDDSVRSITGVPQGEFQLEISDATGYRLDDRLWIQGVDAPVIQLEDEYVLDPARPILLDAGEHPFGTTYEWACGGTVLGNGRMVTLDRTGDCRCTVNSNGCLARKEFRVRTNEKVGEFEMAAMPNPTPDGRFKLNIAFGEPTSAELFITNGQGSVVERRGLSGNDYYSLELAVEPGGSYLISITSGQSTRTLKLVAP